MVRVVEHDDGLLAVCFRAILTAFSTGFGPGVEQGGLLRVVARGEAVEGLGDLDVAVVRGDREARVRERGDLLLHGLDHAGVRVADARHGDAEPRSTSELPSASYDHPAAGRDDRDGHRDTDAGGDPLRPSVPAARGSAGRHPP